MDNEERAIEALERAEMEKGPEPDDKALYFVIDSDEKAEWALKKIKEAEDEHDRLMALIEQEQASLNERRETFDRALERETDFLKSALNTYMRTVKCKATKTQESYQLLTGKLVRKMPSVDFNVDSEALVNWLRVNGRDNLVQVVEKPRWSDLKKLLKADIESGSAVIESTGELVEGVKAVESPEKFSIKFN